MGHSVTLHGCTIERLCLVGIGAIVLNGAVVGEESIVAAGALVPEGMEVPPRSVVMGVPGEGAPAGDRGGAGRACGGTPQSYVGYKEDYRSAEEGA